MCDLAGPMCARNSSAVDWAAGQITPTGAAELVRERPWATVHRIPTERGLAWLKDCGPLVAFEVGLYELLARVVPERVLTPLATETEHGWLLLPDGGPTLGESASGPALIDGLEQALPRYAELQRALAPHVEELLEVGVSDMRPDVMPARFEEALEVVQAEPEPLKRVAAMRPTVTEWCERLAAGPVPASIDHNDLHAWNILGGARFYDWGDAVVAHPFATMLALGWVEIGERDLIRLRDAYLEPFTDFAPRAELVEELEIACRVGKIARALTWQRATSPYPRDQVHPEWLSGPAESLLSLLEDTWLGRA